MIYEGSFVMGQTTEGVMHGVVEHIMNEGGTLGTPGSEYALESMPPENPAMSVRIYEKENGMWEPTAYSIGMMYKDATVVDMKDTEMENSNMEEDYESIDVYPSAVANSWVVQEYKRRGGTYKSVSVATKTIWDGSMFDTRGFNK